jgi:hypothetical protein
VVERPLELAIFQNCHYRIRTLVLLSSLTYCEQEVIYLELGMFGLGWIYTGEGLDK